MEERFGKQIVVPKKNSRKGENGRVLVIGGSKLFHAAGFWAAVMASKMVDLVHFSSPAMENNELMRVRAKEKFWEGIVVPWEEVEHYIEEDDAILIGPGMIRGDGNQKSESRNQKAITNDSEQIGKWGEEDRTREIVNYLLKKYPGKKWVVDGGALQEVEPDLLNNNMIVTPNVREFAILIAKNQKSEILNPKQTLPAGRQVPNSNDQNKKREQIVELVRKLGGVTILAKGAVDVITDGKETVEVRGGSAGMTKGGTGDVLAGVVVGLYAKSPALASAITASKVNKRASEKLEEKVGPFFGAGELIPMVQRELKKELQYALLKS